MLGFVTIDHYHLDADNQSTNQEYISLPYMIDPRGKARRDPCRLVGEVASC